LPAEILKIKNIIKINETSYEINNLDNENEILIFSNLSYEIMNLPINTKEIWLSNDIREVNIKSTFWLHITFFLVFYIKKNDFFIIYMNKSNRYIKCHS
jgi:hypothetical protein